MLSYETLRYYTSSQCFYHIIKLRNDNVVHELDKFNEVLLYFF